MVSALRHLECSILLIVPYQRLFPDAGSSSHRNRMETPRDGGGRDMSGDRLRIFCPS